MKIIEAIQERLGLRYATLPDAIGWYSGQQAQREDFAAEYYFKGGGPLLKTSLQPIKGGKNKLEKQILEAVQAVTDSRCRYDSIEDALTEYSRAELLDCWLRYEGLIGYTSKILNAMEELGYDIAPEE